MDELLTKLKTLLGEVIDIHRAAALLSWDHETFMPPKGVENRAQQLATLQKIAHQKFISDEIGELLERLRDYNLDPDSDEACLLRVTGRDYEKARKLPADLVARLAKETAMAHDVWVKAKNESNFSLFASNLQTILSLTIEVADLLGHDGCRYDALIDQYEPEMKTDEIRQFFDQLKFEVVPIIHEISEYLDAIDDSYLHRDYDEAKQLSLGRQIAKQIGFDFERGRQDKSVHPFCSSISPNDVRMTTRVNRNNLATALFGTIHETGHGLYDQGFPAQFDRTLLCGGTSLGVHESQSRFWENFVGRSQAFWHLLFPMLREVFPDIITESDSAEDFYRASNKVTPSLIRVEADELTYNLHILLRFELEKDLIDRCLKVSELPEAWNAKMKDYLGVVPRNEARGVLQDIHWSGGWIGYFPTYTLGNLIAAQLNEKIREEITDLDAHVERGEFSPILTWLREKVHRHGRKYPPALLVQKATGKPLSAEAFIRYVKNKFGELYGLK